MSLLWVTAASHKNPPWEEEHRKHVLHPTFEAAGLRDAPCAASYCTDMDEDHSAAFDRAETHLCWGVPDDEYEKPPVERIDLSKPLYGFENNCHPSVLSKYTAHPEARRGRPYVFRHQGKHYIMDGHHGLAGALLRGDSHADVHMIDLDKD